MNINAAISIDIFRPLQSKAILAILEYVMETTKYLLNMLHQF